MWALRPKVGGERTRQCRVGRLVPAYRPRGVCDPSSTGIAPTFGVGQDCRHLWVTSRVDETTGWENNPTRRTFDASIYQLVYSLSRHTRVYQGDSTAVGKILTTEKFVKIC